MSVAIRAAIGARLAEIANAFRPGTPIDDDPNRVFVPPSDSMWLAVRFLDGAEEAFPGQVAQLVRAPLLAYIDIQIPSGTGDGDAVDAAIALRTGLRRFNGPGFRFVNFREGPEGAIDGRYRKQLIAVFRRSFRE